ADPGLRGYRIINGSYNAGVFNWTSDSIVAPVQKRNDSSMYLSYTPIMAWSENGTIGYAITIGVRAGSTGSNKGFQPIIYKTSNSGLSWSLLSGINFASPTYSTILQRLEPVPNSTLVIPHFQTPEGIDATVDMYGNLHLATTISSSAINDQDSLDYTQTFTTENYSWDFSPGKKPYLYDFIGDGSGPWKYITVDTITSEGPSDVSGNPGFSDNPWDDNGGKVRSGSRIQLSRTPDGRYIIYTWAESNPAFTFGGKTWNTDPDVKVRVMDVSNAGLYTMSPTKINVTSIGNNSYVSARGMFHFTSPVSSVQTNTSSTAVSFTLPVTVTNSYPYTQGSPNTHWYARTKLDFALPIPTAIQESNIIDMSSNATVYPNPTKDNTTLTIDLKENAHVDIVIYDVVGKQMNHITANGNIGSNSITLDMNGFAKGIYFVNVKAGNISSTKKVIIE
ncbi:MAG: T9SS type A sorting domain-containing protein, partial [Bacteroidia bacterium]